MKSSVKILAFFLFLVALSGVCAALIGPDNTGDILRPYPVDTIVHKLPRGWDSVEIEYQSEVK